MRGDDPGVAGKVIAATRDAGLGPSDDDVSAWVARAARRRTSSYEALAAAVRALDEATDLVDALVAAALREGVAPPADEPWMDDFDWPSLDSGARWKLVGIAVEDAANASQVSGDDQAAHSSLGAYLRGVVPTLLPEPIDCLEWWLGRARAVSRDRDTGLNFGADAQAVADEWIGEALRSELPTLLRLAVLLQDPVWGASSASETTLLDVYERLGAELPPPRRRAKARKARAPRA